MIPEPRLRRLAERRAVEEQAGGALAAAPDAPAELVQLRQPEALGVLDHHDRRVGHVDADLDHRRGDEDRDVAGAKALHRRVLLGRLHAARG